MTGKLVACTLVWGIGAFAMGCSEQSNGRPVGQLNSTASGSTATAPVGPFPRGTVSANYAIDPATVGPELTLLAPTRGAQLTSNSVEVKVKAEDPNGVADVFIAGAPAILVNGEYVQVVNLGGGLNIVPIEAIDSLGNLTTSYVDVVSGQFQPDTEFLSQSLGVSITKAGLDRVVDIAEQQTATLNLWSLISTGGPLMDTSLVKITANGLNHDPLRFDADGASAGIDVVVDLDNLMLDLTVDPWALRPMQAIVTADRATVTAHATISQSAYTGGGLTGHKALGLEIDQVSVSFGNFDLTTSSGFLNFVLRPFEGTIRRAVEGKIKDMLVDIIDDELSQNLVALDVPAPISIPNPIGGPPMDIEMQMRVDESSGGSGVGVGLTASISAQAVNPTPNAQRDVLVSGTHVQPQVLGPQAFAVVLTSDAVNGLLHALYASGGLSLTLDGTQAPAAGTTFMINARLLYPFLPPVRAVAPDPRTPIVIEVEVGSAPLVDLGNDPTRPYRASVGQAKVRVLIDYMDGAPRAELFTLNMAADVAANILIQNNQIAISNLEISHTRFDVISEPLVDIADQEIEDFLVALVPIITQQYLTQIPAIDIPGLPLGLSLTSPRLDVRPNVLTVFGDL